MKRTKLAAISAAAATALAFPLVAHAETFHSYAISPTTHGAASTVTSDISYPKQTKNGYTDLPSGETVCHNGAACAPADQTVVGSLKITAQFICGFVTTSTFNIVWDSSLGSQTAQSGYTIVSHLTAKTPISVEVYVETNNSDGHYRVWEPSIASFICAGTGGEVVTTTDSSIHTNPSTVGTFTVTDHVTYTDNSTDSGTAQYSTT